MFSESVWKHFSSYVNVGQLFGGHLFFQNERHELRVRSNGSDDGNRTKWPGMAALAQTVLHYLLFAYMFSDCSYLTWRLYALPSANDTSDYLKTIIHLVTRLAAWIVVLLVWINREAIVNLVNMMKHFGSTETSRKYNFL